MNLETEQYELIQWYPSLPSDWEEGMKMQLDTDTKLNIFCPVDNTISYKRLFGSELRNKPKFWKKVQCKKKYRNLIFKSKIDDYGWQQSGNEKLINKFGNYVFYNPQIHYIHSVERLPDKQRFTIDDKVRTKSGNISKIIQFFEIENLKSEVGVLLENKTRRTLSEIEFPRLLFTTCDGVDIYESDKTWAVDIYDCKITPDSPYAYVGDAKPQFKYFSTEENAKECVEYNAPKYSQRDIDEAIEVSRGREVLDINYFLTELKGKNEN